ncbi:MAG: DNA mismatch repair endonuclease MutL [Nitrospirota bacterium]
MPSIRILPEELVNKIAAGEVVERPASIVKELVENSIDAKSTRITIDIQQGGKKLIRLADNGCGMEREDAILAFERHATSKLRDEAGLWAIKTMGFRGEALPSIASVSRLMMVTSIDAARLGVKVEIEGGRLIGVYDTGAPKGTLVEVKDIFFNMPARLKFLKAMNTELRHIIEIVTQHAIANYRIHFTLSHNRKLLFDFPDSRDIRSRLHQIYGMEFVESLKEIDSKSDHLNVHGFVSLPQVTMADRTHQVFFVNGRPVRNATLTHALYEAYRNTIHKDRHPVAFLFIEMEPASVDVNVHPTKREVAFRDQGSIHDMVVTAIRERIGSLETVNDKERKDIISEHFQWRDIENGKWWEVESDVAFHSRVMEEMQGYLLSTDREDYRFIQIDGTFIVAVSHQGITIIDQHAAHERILYETLKKAYNFKQITSQSLLIPVVIELSPAETIILREQMGLITSIGIEVEEFSGASFIIRSVPSVLSGCDPRMLLLDLLTTISKNTSTNLMDAVMATMACHGAVRANQPLNSNQMSQLMKDLEKTDMPHTCPHGRPTIIRFMTEELKRMFKRR